MMKVAAAVVWEKEQAFSIEEMELEEPRRHAQARPEDRLRRTLEKEEGGCWPR